MEPLNFIYNRICKLYLVLMVKFNQPKGYTLNLTDKKQRSVVDHINSVKN